MPKATKEVKFDNEKDNEVKLKKSTTATKKRNMSAHKKTDASKTEIKAKSSTTKKTESKEKKTTTKNATTKSKSTSSAKKSSTVKKETSTTTKRKTTTKKTSTTANKKTSSTSKTKKRSASKVKKLDSNIVAEYYDLPYRYNETIVKILYQMPTILFVYWDISDDDKENFLKQYGENFFNNTRPILKIFNLTKNYNFEVEINDFANSWYIHVNDANCEYKVELGRRTIKFEEDLNTDYIYISSSNDIEFPNDRILLEQLPDIIRFKNVQTNQISTKNIGTLHLVGINKIYKAHDFYKKFYKDEILREINSNKIINPSSSWS